MRNMDCENVERIPPLEDYLQIMLGNVQCGATHNNFEYRLDASLGKSGYLVYTNINQRLTMRSMLLIIRKITRFTFIALEEATRCRCSEWKRQEFVIYSKSRRARGSVCAQP